jgi:hypothetical protein
MAVSLEQIEAMVDELAPTDQVRLLQYLVPRLADALLTRDASRDKTPHVGDAWLEFRRVGDRLAAMPIAESLTRAISDLRR